MKNQKMYEADDKMISIIRDNYNILQSLGSFGINLGFGDKTVREVCEEQLVDTYTFLAVVNYTINGYKEYDNADRLSLPTLLHYLKASHVYYIDFQLPFIRKELVEALDERIIWHVLSSNFMMIMPIALLITCGMKKRWYSLMFRHL